MDKNINTREKREIAWSLINSYQYHSKGTGFNEWKPETPQYVKDLQQLLFKTHNNWANQ